ncbi:fumarylacetoacetate hydrolase family protein [Hoeflea sp. TYP-13]|uniref:fumarylacetoacetate hydrolase family protein n=1 Tax=Hoeflea sp. TYP-13 TaxID=3230023 RepID=UPI0034C61E0F
MKLASFEKNGVAGYGVVENDRLLDVSAVLGEKYRTLRAIMTAGALAEVGKAARSAPQRPIDEISFLPVIPDPSKIICIGINYATHIAEAGRETPQYPMIFVRFSESQTGHRQPMIIPAESGKFDFEGELAVVIGRGGRRIPRERALDHVAGYACYNDGSVRDWQRHSTQFTAGKNFPGTGAFGPWLVTGDEIPDPSRLELETRLNGEVMQRAPISDLVFDVPALIEYCSTMTQLTPGDVIITGTTGGVGAFRNPPLFMRDGDTVEVEITQIGTLTNRVQAEKV